MSIPQSWSIMGYTLRAAQVDQRPIRV